MFNLMFPRSFSAVPGCQFEGVAGQSATCPHSRPARLLGLPMNAPVAEVRRIFKDPSGTVIYLAEVTYRGDAIHVQMDLKP